MVSLKWGDVLSHLLPGAVLLYAAAPLFPRLHALTTDPSKIGAALGLALLMAAALAGGILEAWTRVTWEKYLVRRVSTSAKVLERLTKDNLELYERGVQSSYKYVTFYANFAWAVLALAAQRWFFGYPTPLSTLVLLGTAGLLLRASFVQWTYYVNYQNKVFGPRSPDAEERSAPGNAGTNPPHRGEGEAPASRLDP